MNRVPFVLLLVSVLGSSGISVLYGSYATNESEDITRNNVDQPTNVTAGESFVRKDSFLETATVSQSDDQDPSESSETVVYNRFEKPPSDEPENTASDEEEEPEGPADHSIPYSEHEETRNVPTKPRYVAPGEWAKPSKGEQPANLDFVPSKVYAQVRKTHTSRRLPRRKAIENAESDEEKENAARLREVVKNSKVNTVYTEEGYEDSAYDHAGHVRDADFREGYARKLRDRSDLRKKAENGGDTDDTEDVDEEENETRQRTYEKKVRPDEFKDFDEDYRDGYEQTDTERTRSHTDDVRGDGKWKKMVRPKEIAEEGIEKLQEDLEREAEEIEKGVEIGKLENFETTTETLTESRRSEDYDRARDLRWRRARGRTRLSPSTRNDRSREDLEKFSASQNFANSTADTVDRARESVTFAEGSDRDSSRPYKYETDGNSSPNVDAIGYEKVEENPTTISYSQLFWEYFKKQDNRLSTTEAPVALEPTALNPSMLQGSPSVDNANGIAAYPVYVQESTTSYPILESAILSPRPILPIVSIDQTLVHTGYPKDNVQSSLAIPLGMANANEPWHPYGSNVLSTTEAIPYLEIYPNEQNLDSDEESGKNFDGTLFDPPLLNSLVQRKPRYKITIRHKPKKPSEYPASSSQGPVTPNPVIEPMIENATPDPVLINENYAKMLMHLQNERNAKNHYHPNVAQQNNFPSSSNGKNELEDLTRLRPPLPQKPSHYYYDLVPLRARPEIDAAPSDWRVFPVHQRSPQLAHSVPRKPSVHGGDSRQHAMQTSRKQPRHPSDRKRNVLPPFELLPSDSMLGNDPIRHTDTIDYVNRHSGGYRSKRARNVRRPFRQTYDAVRGIRAKTRERRSARRGRTEGNESSSHAKGSIANNGTSNRGEIERPAKCPAIERNCRQKVTRAVEVGLVPDTSPAKQPAKKKSRSCANDRGGEGPRAAERESDAVVVDDGNEGRLGDIDDEISEAFGCDGSGESVGNVESIKMEDGREMEWSNSGVVVSDGVDIGKGNETEMRNAGVVESIMEDELEEFEEWLNLNESKMNRGENGSGTVVSAREKRDVDKVESNGKEEFGKYGRLQHLEGFKPHGVEGRRKRNAEQVDSRVNDKSKQHGRLLDDAPRITEDVIEKEINSRFNENKGNEERKENREKKVEVEVPEFDYVEEIIEDEEDQVEENIATTEESLDLRKYPFYDNEKLPMASALKYATDPNRLPRKSHGGMEFYSSRDTYKHCDEVEPNLEVAPEKEEPAAEKGPNENPPRLRGLGDKLDCFKAKYFDSNPFDNPLFLEKEVEQPAVPPQLDTLRFASRIMILPKENDDFVIQRSSKRPENYRQPRKPISVRLQKTRRIRYKNYPRTRTGTRTRPRTRPPVYRLQVPQVRNTSTSKKTQNSVKSPIAAASEISSFYTPYQNQVYEDVMGTIKNMASLYQVDEVTTTTVSPEETTVMPEIDDDVKTNSTTNSTSYGSRDKGKVRIDIMNRPNDVDINIKDMARPKNRNRYRPVYKRTRRPARNKPRIQMIQTPVVSLRTVKHRPRVRVYKRDLSDVDDSREIKWARGSKELNSTENDGEISEGRGNLEENNNRRTDSANINKSEILVVNINPGAKSVKDPSVWKNSRTKRKTKVLKSVRSIGPANDEEDRKREKSGKVVYTIKDRIRYSKPKNELRRVGKFVNETKVEEDERRREPRYNSIGRKNSVNSLSSTVEASMPSTIVTTNSSETTTTTEKVIEADDPGFKEENKQVGFIVDETRNENDTTAKPGDIQRGTIEQPKEEAANKTEGGYAVYENVKEGETTTTTTTSTTQRPRSATPSEFFSLKTFLEIDPPGYMELSSDDFKRSFFSNDNSTDNVTTNLDSLHANRTENQTEKDAGPLTNFGPPYFSDEVEETSCEKAETKTKVQSSTESSEESSAARSKENDSEEDRTFFSYTSRPYSPAEIYEDPKYSDLGPRVNKPVFFHPPFSKYGKSRSEVSVEEVAESDERKEEYVFPWHKDKEDQRRRRRGRSRGKSTGEYEYPWERRERLAREEKLSKEARRKRLGKGFDDDHDDGDEAEETYVSKVQRNPYPRGRYRYWSRKDRDAAEDNISDNTENGSEYQPTMKYSSRYNSKSSKLPLTDKPTKPKRGSVEEISKSIKKALEGDSEEKIASREKGDEDGSWEKKKSFSYRPRSISRGIVPEDVTLAPTRKSGKGGKSKANDSGEATKENQNSGEARNSLDNSESRITTVKSNSREAGNSTNESGSSRQSSKKRRRPPKSTVSTVESTTKTTANEANRARRKQKSASTTPPTIASTTSASRVIRRRNPKLLKDSKKYEGSKTRNKSSNDLDNGIGMSKTGTVEHRSRGRKKNRTNEIVNDLAKNENERDLSTNSSRKREHSDKVNDEQQRNLRNETVDKKPIDDEWNKAEKTTDSKQTYPTVSEERYDYKEQRTVALNDFDRSDRTYDDDDEEYDSGSVIETGPNFAPQNGAVQLSEQGSRELVTSVSWTSENYDF